MIRTVFAGNWNAAHSWNRVLVKGKNVRPNRSLPAHPSAAAVAAGPDGEARSPGSAADGIAPGEASWQARDAFSHADYYCAGVTLAASK